MTTTRVIDDLTMIVERGGLLYRFETDGVAWQRREFFTVPIVRKLRQCPTRLLVGTSKWAFSSCRYQNGAVTDTLYLLRSPTCLEMWDPWLVRASGEWWNGKIPLNVGLPANFHVKQIAATGPFLAIAGTLSGRQTVAYRRYNADFVGLHPLLTYKGMVDWSPGPLLRVVKRLLMATGVNIPPLDPVILPDMDCWTFFPVRSQARLCWQLNAQQWNVDGTYEISFTNHTLAARRVDAPVVPTMHSIHDGNSEFDYDWIGQPAFPATHFDQCVDVLHGKPLFCRLSLLDFLRANGDGHVVDASGNSMRGHVSITINV